MKSFGLNNLYLLKKKFKGTFFTFQPSFIKYTFVEKYTIEDKLRKHLKIENLEVVDTSGNCGTSFMIKIKSPDLKGKTIINQHRTINEILKDEMKDMHALQLKIEP